MPPPGFTRSFHRERKTVSFIVLAMLTSGATVILGMLPNVEGHGLGLESLPGPFVGVGNVMNSSSVVASSVGHGPCGGCHTMDVMGAIMVGAKFGLSTDNGTMEATMDDYISTYNFTSAKVEMKDLTSNLIVIGGPGVNQITWHYNDLKYPNGSWVLQAYFRKFGNGTDYIYVRSNGHCYVIERDGLGRVSSDYGLVETLHDNGRHVLILAGLGGSGTWAACKVVSSFETWNLQGSVAIVRYRDSNGDGFLDSLSIAEQVSGTIIYSGFAPVPIMLFAAALLPKLKSLKHKLVGRRKFILAFVVLFMAVASQVSFVAFSGDPETGPYTFKELTHPFVSAGGQLNSTAVVASSVGHGPCGGCHTMDVMGAIMVGAQFGTDATGGSLDSTLDDYISFYDLSTGQMTFAPLATNLMVVGGPGVNQVTWYYNNLRNASGARVLPVYFDKFPNGTDYIYVVATDHYYAIERDGLGRVSADYGVVILYNDFAHGWWAVIAAGLGGAGTSVASRLLATYKSWSLFGQAIIVKYADTDADGFLDSVSVSEVAGVGKSIDVFWDTDCRNAVNSIDWGTLVPGDRKNLTIYVRNEGEAGTVLSLLVSGWLPLEASNFLNVGWNYSGTAVQPGQTVPIELTMDVNAEIIGITNFGVNITVSSG